MMQAVFPPGVIAVTLSGPTNCLQNQRAGGVLFGRDMASKPWLDHVFFGDDDTEGGIHSEHSTPAHILLLVRALHAVQSGRREQHSIVVGAMGTQREHYLQTRQWPVSSRFFAIAVTFYIFLPEPYQSQIRSLCWQTCKVSIKGFCPDFNSVRGGFQKSCAQTAQTFAIFPPGFWGTTLSRGVKDFHSFTSLRIEFQDVQPWATLEAYMHETGTFKVLLGEVALWHPRV